MEKIGTSGLFLYCPKLRRFFMFKKKLRKGEKKKGRNGRSVSGEVGERKEKRTREMINLQIYYLSLYRKRILDQHFPLNLLSLSCSV